MTASRKGLLHGNTITLEAEIPPLEGQRVLVLVEPLEEQLTLTAEQQAALWREWVERGPQGPIEDDEP